MYKGVEVDLLKPSVILYIINTVLQVTVSLGKISNQKMLNNTLSILVEVLGELYLTLEDLLVDSHRVFISEGVNTGDHFVNDDTKSPPINGLTVT